MKMHLRTQDDVMTQDQNQVSTTNIPNKIQLPHNNSNKSLLSEKEPRQVYISLRESKLSGSASSGDTYGNFLNYVESDKFIRKIPRCLMIVTLFVYSLQFHR